MIPADRARGCRVVLFDFGGTLDADGVAWKERFHRLWCEEAEDLSPERFAQAFYAADDAVVGAIPVDLPFREMVERIGWGLAETLKRQDRQLGGRIAARFYEEAWSRLQASKRVLKQLSERYRLGIVSNFYGNLESVCAEAGLRPYLSVMVDSACVGCVKPDPRIFREALQAVQAEPAEAIFVGDSLPRDMVGAKGVGMPHVWLTPKGTPCGPSCCPNDRVIHAVDELLEFL